MYVYNTMIKYFCRNYDGMIPYVEVTGDHKAAGFQLGQKLRKQMRRQIMRCNVFYGKEYKKNIQALHPIARRFLPHAQRYFPQYIKELRGAAEGAGVSFDDLLVIMCEEEVVSVLLSRIPEKCTTIGAKIKNTYFLAHNEDYDPIYSFYVVKAKIKGEPSYMSIAYMGTLAGSSAAFNPFLAFSGNAIQSIKCTYGVPKNFLLRAMCTKKNHDDVIALWNMIPRGIGTNFLFVTKNGIYNLEMTSDKIALSHDKKLLYHTNHIVHPLLEGTSEAPTQSSFVRYVRLKELFRNKRVTRSMLQNALMDHQGVCRHQKDIKTLCASVIDLKKQFLTVYKGNPCRKKKRAFIL